MGASACWERSLLRTLHMYLARDLLRITVLALAAFTLVMTIFAVMEPMRKQGLSTEQVISLFGFTLPMMVSLTLPVAALFATTIIYGRFSQENELLASNASGIATLSLLKPALMLGLGVTVASLALSNFVTPKMAALGSMAVKANIKNIFYNKLRTQGYVDYGYFVIHADSTDPQRDQLDGVVVVNAKKPDDVQMAMAASSNIYFTEEQGEYFATIYLHNAAAVRPALRRVVLQTFFPVYSIPLPPPLKEEPSWYDWSKLWRMYNDPWQNKEIEQYANRLLRSVSHDKLLEEIRSFTDAGKPYARLQDQNFTYVVRAGAVDVESGVQAKLRSRTDIQPPRRVEVEVRNLQDGQLVRRVKADSGQIIPTWTARPYEGLYPGNPAKGKTLVTIELQGNVTVEEPAAVPGPGPGPAFQSHRLEEWTVGTPEMPAEMLSNTLGRAREIFDNPEAFPQWVKSHAFDIKTRVMGKLKVNLLAEMHTRVAYGLSCFLMVAMGAALGLLFRGGQMISAFALSMVPGSVIIIILLMGKEMIRNTGVPTHYGLIAVWGGIVVLAVANIGLFWRLARR